MALIAGYVPAVYHSAARCNPILFARAGRTVKGKQQFLPQRVCDQRANASASILPPQAFLDELAEHVPRKRENGQDVAQPV